MITGDIVCKKWGQALYGHCTFAKIGLTFVLIKEKDYADCDINMMN